MKLKLRNRSSHYFSETFFQEEWQREWIHPENKRLHDLQQRWINLSNNRVNIHIQESQMKRNQKIKISIIQKIIGMKISSKAVETNIRLKII